jgi:hypothetical protein
MSVTSNLTNSYTESKIFIRNQLIVKTSIPQTWENQRVFLNSRGGKKILAVALFFYYCTIGRKDQYRVDEQKTIVYVGIPCQMFSFDLI